jgi:hypothetical protein
VLAHLDQPLVQRRLRCLLDEDIAVAHDRRKASKGIVSRELRPTGVVESARLIEIKLVRAGSGTLV